MKHLANPLLWLLLAFALYLVGLGAVGFVGPDEPRYADVARGMMRTGDYITPRLFGSPWFEKPPLYYWLAALFFRTGVNEIGARLPSAVAACLLIAVWLAFCGRLFGARAAALSSLILGSTVGWIGFAHAATMDMLFSATLDAALLMLGMWFWRKQEEHLYVFYVLLGLATLAKGPAAVVLAGLIALAYAATFREWKLLRETLYTPGVILFAVVALPWYLLCYHRNGFVFIQTFIIEHNFGRYVSTALGHPQPLWYYIPVLMAGLFPWTPMLLLPLAELFRTPQTIFRDKQRAFLFFWVFIIFAFFSFSQNKLPGYLLPILPPLALWITLTFERMRAEEPPAEAKAGNKDRNAKRAQALAETTSGTPRSGVETLEAAGEAPEALQKLALLLIGLSAFLLLFVPFLAPRLADSLATGLGQALNASNGARLWTAVWRGPVPPVVWVFLIAPVGLCFYMLWRRDLIEAVLLITAGVAVCMMAAVNYLSPGINRVASVRSVAQRMQALDIQGEQVAVTGIHRNQALGLDFYLDRELPEWDPKAIPPNISYIVAKEGEHFPEAQSLVFFPGQRLRLWVLPPSQFEIHIEETPPKSPSGKAN